MKHRYRVCAGLAGILLTSTIAFPQTKLAATFGPAANGSPAWFLQGMQGMIQTRAKPKPDAGLAC